MPPISWTLKVKFKKWEAYLCWLTCDACMMPYITSFFMPRNDTDRPQVVPEHAKKIM